MDTRKYSVQDVYQVMRKLGYPVTGKYYELNLIGIRAEESRSDSFDDVFYATRNRAHAVESIVTPFTSDPGKHWLLNPLNVKGTAIMVPGFYSRVYKRGLHKGGYEAFVQSGPIAFVRDNNKNNTLDFDLYRDPQKRRDHLKFEIIGANIHRTARMKILANVGPNSAACQVLQVAPVFDQLITWRDEHITRHGDAFNYALLEERDIINTLGR